MWVLDTGKIGEKRICLPQLVVIDMKTDKIIHRYQIPADQLVCELSLLVNLVRYYRRLHCFEYPITDNLHPISSL